MRLFLCGILLISAMSKAVANNLDGWTPRYATALLILNHLTVENDELAIFYCRRFFEEYSQNAYREQASAREKMGLISLVTQDPIWWTIKPSTRFQILSIAAEEKAMTATNRRELIYILMRSPDLNSMALALKLARGSATYDLADSTGKPIISKWRRLWERWARGQKFLAQTQPVDAEEVAVQIMQWADKQFRHPDQLIALVQRDTSPEALRLVRVILSLKGGWLEALTVEQETRLNFWSRIKSCEDKLSGPGSKG